MANCWYWIISSPWSVVSSQLHLIFSSLPNLQSAQRDHRKKNAQNVESHYDLRLVPPFLLEMMVDRCHQENSATGTIAPFCVFEPTGLQNDGAGFHHKHTPRDN